MTHADCLSLRSIQQRDHLIGAGNLELRHPGSLQAIVNHRRRIEQLQLDVMRMRPSLHVSQHPKSAAFNLLNLRQIYNHNATITLRTDHVTQAKRGIALDDSAFTLHYGYIPYVLKMYVEHISSSMNVQARALPILEVDGSVAI
jgi:hypothetical protein